MQRPSQEIRKPLGLHGLSLIHGDWESIYPPAMDSFTDVGTLLTWEKVVTYHHEPPDFGSLRDSCKLSQLLLLNHTFRILSLCFEPTQGCQKCDRSHRDSRWIGGLTKVTICPTYAICCERLWSMQAPIPGPRDTRWPTTQLTCKQLKSY